MKNFAFYFFALLATATLFSCQKEVSFDTPPSQLPGTGGGVSGKNYQPLTAGSFWKYKDSASSTIYTLTAINKTKMIGSRLFTALLSNNGTQTDTAYQAVVGADYFLTAKGVSPSSGATYDLLFHYLNDTAAVGTNWEYPAGQGNGFQAFIKTTIMERNITHKVLNKVYANVIHTRLNFKYDILGSIQEFAIYDYYIAKDVGVVQVTSDINALGITFRAVSDITEYQIK